MNRLPPLLLCLALFCGSCSRETPSSSTKPVIVVSIYPLQSLVEQLAAGKADVVCLLPSGISSHNYEPSPRQRAAVERADLIVTVGPGIDDWAIALAKRQRKKGASALSMSGVLGLADESHEHDHNDHDHAHEHDHKGPNMHLWLDPALTEKFVRDHLGPAVVKLTGEPINNLLADEIAKLDAELAEMLKPYRDGKIITFHNAFDLMANHYGLEVAATLSLSSNPGQVTPSQINRALEIIRSHKLKAVFIEPQFPPEAVNALRSAEKDLQVLTLDPLGDPSDPQRDSYQDLLRYNVETIIKGLDAGGKP